MFLIEVSLFLSDTGDRCYLSDNILLHHLTSLHTILKDTLDKTSSHQTSCLGCLDDGPPSTDGGPSLRQPTVSGGIPLQAGISDEDSTCYKMIREVVARGRNSSSIKSLSNAVCLKSLALQTLAIRSLEIHVADRLFSSDHILCIVHNSFSFNSN